MTKIESGRVVFTGTAEWWQIASTEIETADAWEDDWQSAAQVAELTLEDEECWVAQVLAVSSRHTAIRVGDWACCQGVGSDVVFVRLER